VGERVAKGGLLCLGQARLPAWQPMRARFGAPERCPESEDFDSVALCRPPGFEGLPYLLQLLVQIPELPLDTFDTA
jgi:hypothetical protein